MKRADRKTVQYFADDYIEHCRQLTPEQIVEFLESFRRLHAPRGKSRLISLKVDEALLDAFRRRCEIEGLRYQTQIKTLMSAWLDPEENQPTVGFTR